MVKTTLIPEPKNVNDFGTRVNVIDAPELGAVTKAISANWAYLHLTSDSPHGLYAPIGGIPIQLACYYFTPSTSTDYNVGMLASRTPQTAGYARAYSPRSGVIKAVLGHFWNGGTTSGETSELYLDITNASGTTPFLISSAIVNNATIVPFLKYDLSIPIDQGDFLELRWSTPSSWASGAPTNVHIMATIYVDCGSEAVQPPPPEPPGDLDTYGAGAYDEAEGQIGGGAGYYDIKTQAYPNDATHTIYSTDTAAQVVSKIEGAHSGDIIYLEPDVDIDLSGYTYVDIPGGVTLASNRGGGGTALGGRIYYNTQTTQFVPLIRAVGHGVRMTGLRLKGPDPDIGSSPTENPRTEGIRCYGYYNFEVDNCEVSEWPYGGIVYWGDGLTGGLYDPARAKLHHNYIHHCRRTGYGYGIQVSVATAYIYANHFNYQRHHVSGERNTPANNIESCYNIYDEYCTNNMHDQHGGNDDSSTKPAGNYNYIHHNTFKGRDVWDGSMVGRNQPPTHVRGIPQTMAYYYRNWTYYPANRTYVAFLQSVYNVPGYSGYYIPPQPYINMQTVDNLYGEFSDPS